MKKTQNINWPLVGAYGGVQDERADDVIRLEGCYERKLTAKDGGSCWLFSEWIAKDFEGITCWYLMKEFHIDKSSIKMLNTLQYVKKHLDDDKAR